MDYSPHPSRRGWRWFLTLGFGVAGTVCLAPLHAQEMCGMVEYPFPYTDVSGVGAPFCPGIMEAYVTGVSKGTTPTTFSPNDTVTRVQMTTFLQRSLDQGLARTSRRAALNQWWTPQNTASMQTINVGGNAQFCAVDGENIWTSTFGSVAQVEANSGAVLGTWTGASQSEGVALAAGKIFVAGATSPGSLYVIDPTVAPGAVTVAASTLGNHPVGIAFDGNNLWTANFTGGSVSIITPQSPYTVSTVTTGFTSPYGLVYDGTSIWVTDEGAGKLLKLSATGAITQTVTVGTAPEIPTFDGANIWVPNNGSNSITVVQASTGTVVATISTNSINQLNAPFAASFDGERILVTNNNGKSVTLFKAADLSFIAVVPTGSVGPLGACSDAINFWVNVGSSGNMLRF
jgi:hypothetical protein